jgi:hypothetical protein
MNEYRVCLKKRIGLYYDKFPSLRLRYSIDLYHGLKSKDGSIALFQTVAEDQHVSLCGCIS